MRMTIPVSIHTNHISNLAILSNNFVLLLVICAHASAQGAVLCVPSLLLLEQITSNCVRKRCILLATKGEHAHEPTWNSFTDAICKGDGDRVFQ